MDLRNNNRSVVKLLAQKNSRYHKVTNRVLLWSAAGVVLVVFCVLSFAAGRVEVDRIAAVRGSGEAENFTINQPSDKQYKTIAELPYVTAAYKEWNLGTGVIKDAPVFFYTFIGEQGFKQIYEPAYTEVEGSYPQKKNEVMLPVRVLKELGVSQPQVGQKLKLSMKKGRKAIQQQWILSGYFEEYFDMVNMPIKGFVSRQYWQTFQKSSPQYLKFITKQMPKSHTVQEKQKAQIETDTGLKGIQGYYNGIREPGVIYGTAMIFVVLMMICGMLLLNNVIAILIHGSRNHYGLLKLLGASQKQVKAIALRQILKTSGAGAVIGAGAGCLVVLVFIPILLKDLYLIEYGSGVPFIGFHPLLLLISVLLAGLTILISAMGQVRKAGRYSPMEDRDHIEKLGVSKKFTPTNHGNRIYRQAWRNVFRSKRKAAVTILSLVLGMITVLSAAMITEGYDNSRWLDKESDFQLYGSYMPWPSGENNNNITYFDRPTINKIEVVPGVKKVQYHKVGFLRLDESELVWQPRSRGEIMYGGAVLVDQHYIDRLEAYSVKKNLQLDIEGLRKGTSAMELHGNEFSEKEEKKANQQIGQPFIIENINGESLGKLNFGGYVNRGAKGFPKTSLVIHSAHDPILIMTAQGFARAGLTPFIQDLEIWVDQKLQPEAKKALESIVYERNKALYPETKDTYNLSMNAKSDTVNYNRQYTLAMAILAYGITFMLFLMGVLGYFNVIYTGLADRKGELALLECLGMTRRELRRMLIMEGCCYGGIVTAASVIAAIPVLGILAAAIKKNVYTFRYVYPWEEMAGLIMVLFILVIGIPLIMFQVEEKNSVVDRLRDTE